MPLSMCRTHLSLFLGFVQRGLQALVGGSASGHVQCPLSLGLWSSMLWEGKTDVPLGMCRVPLSLGRLVQMCLNALVVQGQKCLWACAVSSSFPRLVQMELQALARVPGHVQSAFIPQ